MQNWKRLRICPAESILTAISQINAENGNILLVCDNRNQLLGTVTDGDVRRGLLRSVPLSAAVAEIMNASPTVVTSDVSRIETLRMMQDLRIRHLPVVNAKGVIIGLHTLQDLIAPIKRPNTVVLMAGGFGQRLRPLTDSVPKPLLTVGSKPLLETIVELFRNAGFQNLYLSVHYKADMIKAHFRDGSDWGVSINYLDETEPLGTAGCLRLLPERPQAPIVVMNGDILTKIELGSLIEFHQATASLGTMCVREYDYAVPYGVVELQHEGIRRIVEKPVQKMFINAGIYVLSPEALDIIPTSGLYNMTTLFEDIINLGKKALSFPIHEYWVDIGQIGDYEQARLDFAHQFASNLPGKTP